LRQGKESRAVCGRCTRGHGSAARFTANHQPPQGYRRSSGQDEVREATYPEFDVAIHFNTGTTCTAWRPRGLPPNRQPPNNTDPRYDPPAPPASMPSAGSFQGPPRSFVPPRFSSTPRPPGPSGCSGPSGFRQPRPHLAGCWECENMVATVTFINRMDWHHVRLVHRHPVWISEIVVGDKVVGCVAAMSVTR